MSNHPYQSRCGRGARRVVALAKRCLALNSRLLEYKQIQAKVLQLEVYYMRTWMLELRCRDRNGMRTTEDWTKKERKSAFPGRDRVGDVKR